MSQNMKMDQRMVLAPRMIQSMEILQLPLLELQERIEQELLSNPMLEIEEPEQPAAEQTREREDGETSLEIQDGPRKAEDFERLDNSSSDLGDYFGRGDYVKTRRRSDDIDHKYEAMQNTAAPEVSLNEYLKEQWAFIECDQAIRKIGDAIVDLIDDAGYLSVPTQQIPESLQEPVTENQVDEALQLVQTLEPPGVGARDLAECLRLQFNGSADNHHLELELITKYLKDIEMNRFPAIAKKTGKSIAEIKEAIRTISRLDPRPGLQVGQHDVSYVLPDIIVDYDEQNDVYSARLTSGTVPSIKINAMYNQMLKQNNMTEKTREFLQNNARSARWLVESIEQRKSTLLRVVYHVIQNQRDFLENGPLHLHALPMVDVAEALGIHVGTVSRAVSGKYMQTPVGIFPLRFFFSGGRETADGDNVSWDAIRAKLQEIIDNEDKAKPFNDDELVEQLAAQGIELARRTVAKYRGLMNVPPARRRKQFD
jgi:RNA polymerase sigma-54 factor